ncbi:MAG: arylamine N-acetyltransferase family protein [Stackebrandtia sp.]
MRSLDVEAYLERLGVEERPAVDVESLARLQQRHVRAVPFENLSIHLGEPIVLDAAALWHKILTRRRGGFCYELNGAFAALLSALGFSVTLLMARVFNNGEPGPPFDHLALRVELDEPWLVDVGFGRFAQRPLRLNSRADQPDPAGTARVRPADDGDLDVLLDGKAQYRLEAKPRRLADFAAMCWYQANSPDSPFSRSLTCSLVTDDGRVTLSGDRLIVTADGEKREETLPSEAEVLAAYRRHFGIELDRPPTIRTS